MKAQDLKNSILQLAIQGKLVPQDPNDEPADILYEKIQSEKQKLIKEGKIKKDKPLLPITDDETPFEIPSTWKWVRFGDVVKYNMGKTPSRNDYEMWGSDYPWVSIADLVDGKTITVTKEQISKKSYDDVFKKRIIPAGTLLMSFKLTIGKISILGFDGFHNEAIISIFPYVDTGKIMTMYLFKLLPYLTIFSTETKTAVKGITLNSDSLNKLLIPLPPLAEQKRIVAKIEELEPLIKQYDKAETELSDLNEAFPEQLKKSILQYAIQGKLVPQDPNDEPADVLYGKIQSEKQQLIKEGKIKKDKPLSPITDDEAPFSIPSSWKWVRLSDIVSSIPTKEHQILQSEILNQGKYPVVSQSQQLIEGYSDRVEKLYKHERPVLIFGDHTRCLKLIDFDFIVGADGVKILYPYALNEKYLYYAIQYFIINMINRGYSRHFQFIKDKEIPLPPLAEQKRIVAKVDELMQYCDKLKA